MISKKKTFLNILLILFVVSFFITPLGHYGKIWLNRIFAKSPELIEVSKREKLPNYDWKLKDPEWNFFNFEKSKGRIILINFWASWRLPSEAELEGIQKLYERYKGKMDFYIVTNEERAPVEEFMQEQKFTFPVTYLIIGEKAPFEILEAPGSYLIDEEGYIVVEHLGIADWGSSGAYRIIDQLIIKDEVGVLRH